MQKGDNSLSLRTENQTLDKNTKMTTLKIILNILVHHKSKIAMCPLHKHCPITPLTHSLTTLCFSSITTLPVLVTYLCGGQDLRYKIIFNCSLSGLDTAFQLICQLYWVQRHFHKLAFLPLHVFYPLARPGSLSLQITK